MSFIDTLSITYQTPGNSPTVFSKQYTYNADTECNLDAVCAVNVNTEVDVTFIKANLRSLAITCDQNVLVRTNNVAAPQDTINLLAGIIYPWNVDLNSVFACPFSGDISKMFVEWKPADNTNTVANLYFRSVAKNQV